VEDVAHTTSPPMSLSFSSAGLSSGVGHEDALELGLDTMTDVLS
jgi:hypothetical protein